MRGPVSALISEVMSDLLSRRGFAQLALAAGAGLMLPSTGAADRALAARLVPVPDRTRIVVELYLRHAGRTGVVLAGRAIHLEAELTSAHGDHPLVLRPEVWASRPMSRAAPVRREAPPIVLAPEREQLYARFATLWPRELGGAGGEATLSARAVLDVDIASRPPDERDALRALARVRATTSVTLPA